MAVDDAPAAIPGDPRWKVTAKVNPVDVVVEAADITEGKLTDAITAKAAGKPIKNITITLAENVAYTVTAPIEAGANVVINGAAKAKIDASALTGAFINYASVVGEKAKKADDTESDYTIVENISVKDVEITGLGQSFINNGAGKVLFKKVLVDNSVVEMKGSKAIFALGSGYPEDLQITNSTLWSKEGHTGFLFQAHGKAVDITADSKTSWTIDKSTLYQISVGKKANNTNTFKGKNYLVITLTNSLLYNFGSNVGNEVNGWLFGQNSATPTITYANNAYLSADGAVAGWTDAAKAGSDQTGTSVAGVVTFTDAAAGTFDGTFATTSDITSVTAGDPRWTITVEKLDVTTLDATIAKAEGMLEGKDATVADSPEKTLSDAIAAAKAAKAAAKSQAEVNAANTTLEAAIEAYKTATGINGITVDGAAGDIFSDGKPVYNLSGQRVFKGYKGIVIKNGRKIVVK